MKALKKYVFIPTLILAVLATFYTPAVQAGPLVKTAGTEKSYAEIYERLGLEPPEEVEAAKKEEDQSFYSKDTFVVKLDKPLTSAEHRRLGGQVIKRINSLGFDVIQVRDGKSIETVMETYAKLESIESVSPSAVIQKFAQDPKVDTMYHLPLLNIKEAQKLAGDHKVKVAVIDTGVDYDHPELKNKVIADMNVAEPLRRGTKDSHGTHVAGLVAAEAENGAGGMGVNPNADIVSIDVFNGGWGTSDYAIAEALMIAVEQKVDIINLSLGGPGTKVMEEAVDKALEAGITIVAAAGNNGMSDYPSFPAGYDGVISVGATDENNELAFFSNYGPSIDVVAPGFEVYSSDFLPYKGSSYNRYSGTSMSSPIVAGVASLLLSKHPDLTPVEVMYVLQQSAKDLGTPGFDTKYGFGLIDAVAALKFDVSSIPDLPIVDKADLVSKAEYVELGEKGFDTSGTIELPGETHWWSVNVQKGELVQLLLDGTDPFDYKAVIHYYRLGEQTPSDTFKVNDVIDGKTEGYLFEADEAGTIVIGVKDAYNKYKEDGSSIFNLSLAKYENYLDDGNNKENPHYIEGLPFESEDPLYVADLEGDSDYFRFTVEEPQIVEVNVSGIPGVDPSLLVYFAEEFDQVLTDEMLEGIPEEYLEEIMNMEPWPFQSSNFKGVGEGETLSFEAMPGQEYVVEVTGQPDYYYDPFFMMYDPYYEEMKAKSSHVPYEISIASGEVPQDEDMYPMDGGMYPETGEYSEEVEVPAEPTDIPSFLKKQQMSKQVLDWLYNDMFYYDNGIDPEEILEMAMPYEVGDELSAYFQYSYDVDLMKVTPEQDGIYEFSWTDAQTATPIMEVFKYNEEENRFQYLTDSYWGYYGEIKDNNFTVGLEGGETYIFYVSNRYYQPSLNEYTITSKPLIENPSDAYESNNSPKKTKALPDYAFTGNFALTGDVDMFYFEADKDEVLGFYVEVLTGNRHKQRGVSDELYKTIDPLVVVIEDVDGKGEVNMESPSYMFDRGWDDEDEYGSFKVKKGKGYFIILENWIADPSLTPYRMTVAPAQQGTKSTKPIAEQAEKLVANGANRWSTTGYLKAGIQGGDTGYYSFKLEEKSEVKVTFDVPLDIDGELTLYNKDGKVIRQSKVHSQGDSEVILTTLEKGSYYLGVKDIEGNPSIRPYHVTVDVLSK
ncbi:S8 family peptidase [Bacillus solitudinis]|uniref:S8 family peptidase n=1 Tax=Bacillus solitudinis TaxID=2014074 RepID=UPI0012FDC134|nr:S8 family peptidase [Bacillus solitudinis]